MSPERKAWYAMWDRTTNPDYKGADRYQGRGITVCERWRDPEAFLADMGPRPPGCSLERKDNSLGYSPDNCRWATLKEQNNNKGNNRRLTHQGKTQTIAQWAEETGLAWTTIHTRLKRGCSIEEALMAPIKRRPLTFRGETKSLAEWCRELSLPVGGVTARLRRGWDVASALTKPICH